MAEHSVNDLLRAKGKRSLGHAGYPVHATRGLATSHKFGWGTRCDDCLREQTQDPNVLKLIFAPVWLR